MYKRIGNLSHKRAAKAQTSMSKKHVQMQNLVRALAARLHEV